MVDTIKLLIPIADPMVLSRGAFHPLTVEDLIRSWGVAKTHLNPSSTYAKLGKFMPRLTLYRRPTRTGVIVYQLAVEFSAPKIIYDTNFDELTEDDFEAVLAALQSKLQELVRYSFTRNQLAHADLAAFHPSKNIVFMDYTACQTVLRTLNKLDVSQIYDFQKDRYRDGGHVLHIHSNSFEIAFYDKIKDLRKAKVSDKRGFENNNLVQLNLLEKLKEYRPMEVLRYEVRFNRRASIKRAFPDLDRWTFESLFKKQLCKDTLLKHWNKLSGSVDMLSLDVKQPFELLQNYLDDNQNMAPQASLAAVAGMLIANQVGFSDLRSTLEAHFGKQAWYRLKPLLKAPNANRFSYFVHIDEALENFTPTRMSKLLNNI